MTWLLANHFANWERLTFLKRIYFEKTHATARPMKQPTRPKQFGRAFFVSAADGRDVRLLDVRLSRRLTGLETRDLRRENETRDFLTIDIFHFPQASRHDHMPLVPSSGSKPQATSRNHTSHKPQATSHKPQATSHKPRTTNHEPRTTNHEQRATSNEQQATATPQVTSHEPQATATSQSFVSIV